MKTLYEAAKYMQNLLPGVTCCADNFDGNLVYFLILPSGKHVLVKDKVSSNFFERTEEVQIRYLFDSVAVVKELFKCAIDESVQELNALREKVNTWKRPL